MNRSSAAPSPPLPAAPVSPPAVWPPARNRGGRWSYLIVVGLAVLLWLPRLSGPIDLRYDAGVYFLLGVSLAEGHGYRIPSEPGAPEAVQYPPGLPGLVAAQALVFHTTDPVELGRWLRRTYFLGFIGFALAVLALARTQLSPGWATAATCLCLLQLNTYLLSDLLFAELPFALASVGFAWVLLRPSPHLRRQEGLGFALATAGFLFRSAGLALFAAWVGEALLRRQWRLVLLRSVLSFIPFALWQVHVANVRASHDYRQPAYAYQRAPYQFYNVTYAENVALVDPFRPELGKVNPRALFSRFAENLAVIPSSVGEAVSTTFGFWRWALNSLQDLVTHRRPIPAWAVQVPLYALAVLASVGLGVIAFRRQWVIPVFVLASIALVCATPWPGQFSRYLAPLAAFLSVAAFVGALWIQQSIASANRRSLRRVVLWSLCGLASITVSAQVFTLVQVFVRRQTDPRMPSLGRGEQHHVFYHDRTWSAWENAVTWIGEHAPTDAIIATVSPHLCYLWTGRHAVFPPMEADPLVARQLLQAVPISFVIVDELAFLDTTRLYAEPALARPNSGWRVVYSVDQTRIYARDKSSPETDPTP